MSFDIIICKDNSGELTTNVRSSAARGAQDLPGEKVEHALPPNEYYENSFGEDVSSDNSYSDGDEDVLSNCISTKTRSESVAELAKAIRHWPYCEHAGDLDVYLLGRMDAANNREWVIEDIRLDVEDGKLMLGKARAIITGGNENHSSIWQDLWPEMVRVSGVLQGAIGKLELLLYLLESSRI